MPQKKFRVNTVFFQEIEGFFQRKGEEKEDIKNLLKVSNSSSVEYKVTPGL